MNSFRLKTWQVIVALVALVALFALPLLLAPEGAEFGGADATVTELIEEEHGAKAWFEPLFSPSPEIESGLFALQAGVGAGVLGFALGRLSARSRQD